MNLKLITFAIVISSNTLLAGDQKQELGAPEIHKRVDALMKERKAEEAAPLLEQALELDPKDTQALRTLGLIYTLMLNQPDKAKALAARGWELGDIKCLQVMAISLIATNDHKNIKKFEKDFLENFEHLSGAKVVCFFIAGQNLDEDLFKELLRKTRGEEIEKDESLTMIIARTAKVLADNR